VVAFIFKSERTRKAFEVERDKDEGEPILRASDGCFFSVDIKKGENVAMLKGLRSMEWLAF